jgi:hypothetical protein
MLSAIEFEGFRAAAEDRAPLPFPWPNEGLQFRDLRSLAYLVKGISCMVRRAARAAIAETRSIASLRSVQKHVPQRRPDTRVGMGRLKPLYFGIEISLLLLRIFVKGWAQDLGFAQRRPGLARKRIKVAMREDQLFETRRFPIEQGRSKLAALYDQTAKLRNFGHRRRLRHHHALNGEAAQGQAVLKKRGRHRPGLHRPKRQRPDRLC